MTRPRISLLPLRTPHTWCSLLLSLALLCACGQHKRDPGTNGAFAKAPQTEGATLARISEGGELIIATLSGPDTYFDYQGKAMGLQYALAEDFAATLGVGIRVEVATDTLHLLRLLQRGEADLVALPLPQALLAKHHLQAAGVQHKQGRTAWAVADGADDLARALNAWYSEGMEQRLKQQEHTRMQQRRQVRRQVRAPFISREKGIISTYDAQFKQAAQHTGWDWRLIAAQCYQESGFDPNARSWAGACGLMQIMPATARHLGLPDDKLFAPVENIAAAARYLRELQHTFSDISDPMERACFVLAAYNGGPGHVQDARALARKYRRNDHKWQEVSYYVLHLSEARYYRDPVVRHGYMIGSETYQYVQSVMQRWAMYGGDVQLMRSLPAASRLSQPSSSPASNAAGSTAGRQRKRNRFSKQQQILTPEELQQAQE